MKRAEFVMREVCLSLRILKLSFWTLAVSKMETITSLQLHTQDCVAIQVAPAFSLQPFLTGVNRFPQSHYDLFLFFPEGIQSWAGQGKDK